MGDLATDYLDAMILRLNVTNTLSHYSCDMFVEIKLR